MKNINRACDNQSITCFDLVNNRIYLIVVRTLILAKLKAVIASLAEAIVIIS